MDLKKEWRPFTLYAGVLLAVFYLPVDSLRFQNALLEGLYLVRWYAREHVVLCLLPAFFIAGAIAVFVGQASVMKYLGAGANKVLAYGVASISGSVLAVCSCTILPLFAGIYRMGAGLGPATAFLYAGPAVNVLAIILTARILGFEMGVARAVGAILFSAVIGLSMHTMFRGDERDRANTEPVLPQNKSPRPLWKTALYFGAMIAILVFANWGEPAKNSGFWDLVYSWKWVLTGAGGLALSLILAIWFHVHWAKCAAATVPVVLLAIVFPNEPMVPFVAAVVGLSVIALTSGGETRGWLDSSWGFAKQILPLLLGGVFVAGILLGRPSAEGIIPSEWIVRSVGGNSLGANLFASVAGAFMYFATLTEVPILEGLIGNGMGKGPALALLLAGPALSLPNMLVIRSVIGTKKTLAYVILVIVMATLSGLLYGTLF